MYILTNEPQGGIGKDAFEALDGAFGTGEFSQGQALTVIANAVETDKAAAVFNDLVSGGYVTEVD